MAFAVAGRAAFLLDLDKSALDRGLPAAERQFQSATTSMARSTDTVTSSAGRAASALGGRGGAGLVGRMGLVGAAAYAGINALQEVSKALRVTGYDAGTTEGKLRNFGASLAGGDVVGAIGSLVHVTTLSTKAFEELQIQIYNMDFSTFNAQVAKAAGGLATVTVGAGRGYSGTSTTVNRGPNKAMQEQLRLAALQARDRRITDAASLAGRTPGLQDDLDAQRRRGQFIRDQLKLATPGTDEFSKLSAELTAAVNRRQDLEEKIKGKKPKAEKDADRDRVAPAGIVEAGLNATMTAGLADDLKAATAEENYFRERLSHLKKGTERYTTVLGSLARAHAEKQSVLDKIAAADKAAQAAAASKAKQAAADRKRAAAETARAAEEARAEDARRLRAGLTLREATLRNDLAAADLTEKTLADDRAALRKLIAFDRAQERNRKLTQLERQQYRTKEIQDRKALASLDGATSSASADSFAKQAQAFLNQLSGDIRQYAGNTRRPLTVEQHFHSPVSAFKAGRDAELAARAVRS